MERARAKPPSAWEAYDYYLRGIETFSLHLRGFTISEIYQARRLFAESLTIDPDYGRTYAALSRTHVRTYLEPLDDQYLHPAELQRAYELATKAVISDPNLPFAHSQLGWVLMFKRRYDEAIAEFERALSLNPLAAAYAQLGRATEAEAAEVLRIEPAFTINRWKVTAVYKASADAEHLFEGLRKAGLPES
jgi:tetratricopeptide (TPR) repeat protein